MRRSLKHADFTGRKSARIFVPLNKMEKGYGKTRVKRKIKHLKEKCCDKYIEFSGLRRLVAWSDGWGYFFWGEGGFKRLNTDR